MQTYNDNAPTTDEFAALLPKPLRRFARHCIVDDTQRPVPGAPYGDGVEHTPVFDELHQALRLDDPIRTNQLRMLVVAVERVLRGTATREVKQNAIIAVLAVLGRAYVGAGAASAPDDPSRLRMAFANLARKYFGTPV